MARTVRLVLGQPRYGAVAVVVGALSVLVVVLSLNVSLTVNVILGGSLPLGPRLEVLALQLPFVGPGFTPIQGLVVLLVSALLGIDITLLVYHAREHGLSMSGGSGSMAGLVVGILGAGCAACGPVILAGFLSMIGAAGLFTLLPWEGLEIAAISLGLLALSLYWIADGLRGGEIRGCPVDPSAME